MGTSGCSRPPAGEQVRKFAVLRFENLSGDDSLNWIGRALSESLTQQLQGIPQAAINNGDQLFSPHLPQAPGVSAAREMAIKLGATDLLTGYYDARHGQLSVTAVAYGSVSHKTVRSFRIDGDFLASLRGISKEFGNRPEALLTENEAAWREFARALDSGGPAAEAHFQQAALADGSFGENYLAWTNWAIANRDPAALNRALEAANAHKATLKPLPRAYLDLQAATLHGDQQAKIAALTAIASLTPKDPTAWNKLAEAELGIHQTQAAARHYEQAAALERNSPEAWNVLAYTRMYAGDSAGALAAIHEYQKLRPNDPNTVDSEGDIHFFFGRFSEAERLYLKSFSMNENFNNGVDAWKAARAHLMTGDVAGATSLFSRYLQSRAKAGDPVIAFREAEWQYLIGKHTEGIRSMIAAAASAKTTQIRSLCQTQVAVWEMLNGDRNAATQFAEQALKPTVQETFLTAAITRFAAQPPTTPAEWQARAAKNFNGPGAASVRRVALAYAYTLAHQWPEAATAWKEIFETTTPTDQTAAFLYGGSLRESGRAVEAEPLLKQNPIPAAIPAASFESLYFPALFRWRGEEATYRKLSGEG